jgi:hypothetical protein
MQPRHRSTSGRFLVTRWFVLWLTLASISGLLLAGCSNVDLTPQVVFVTETASPTPAVMVVTATYTAAPEQPTAMPSETLPPPTDTPAPVATKKPFVLPTKQALPTHTDTPPPAPTDTPVPVATDTPLPPANTPTPKPTAKPQASLSSYRVIYSNFDGGSETDEHKYSVWVMRGDGSAAGELLRPAVEPAYSPNGKKVAYYRPFTGIWVYDVPSKGAKHVVVGDYAEFASFSPDGNRLVFHEWMGNWWNADVYLFTMNADGSGRTQLPQGIRPAWSPQGGLIAFDSCRDTNCGIFVVQPNGQGLRQVTSDGGGKVSWSPNGKRLVYSADNDGDPEICIVNLDGSGWKQLTKNKGNDTLPVFTPDGQYIYFLSDQNGTAWAIRVMRADGSDVKTVHRVGVPPRWQFSRLWVNWW